MNEESLKRQKKKKKKKKNPKIALSIFANELIIIVTH